MRQLDKKSLHCNKMHAGLSRKCIGYTFDVGFLRRGQMLPHREGVPFVVLRVFPEPKPKADQATKQKTGIIKVSFV